MTSVLFADGTDMCMKAIYHFFAGHSQDKHFLDLRVGIRLSYQYTDPILNCNLF